MDWECCPCKDAGQSGAESFAVGELHTCAWTAKDLSASLATLRVRVDAQPRAQGPCDISAKYFKCWFKDPPQNLLVLREGMTPHNPSTII